MPFTQSAENSGISEGRIRQEIETALRRWSSHADIVFEHVDDTNSADLAFGAQDIPEGWAYADVEYSATRDETDIIVKGVVCLNPMKKWLLSGTEERSFTLLRTFEHEIGHVLGFDHPTGENCPNEPLGVMNFTERNPLIRANACERAAARKMYGPSRGKGIPSN